MTTHGEIIVHQTNDGNVRLDVRLRDETVWLTQAMMAEPLACSVDNVRELDLEATSGDFSIVRTEGTRQVTRPDTLSSAPEDRGRRLRPCQQELRTDRVTAERSPAGCWSYP